MSAGDLSQVRITICKNRPSRASQAHSNVILCCRTVGNTFCREVKYGTWLNPMVIKLLKNWGK